MAIRSLREHVAGHNWFAVAVDVGVVILGVFLGLQANNWNNDRGERAAAFGYRAEIIDNLIANEISINDQIAYYRQVSDHAVAALSVLEDPRAKPGESFIVDAYQATQIRQRLLTGTAYDEMKNAGGGRSIANADVRARLSSYYSQLPQVNDTTQMFMTYRDRVRSAIPFDVQRQIREQCGDNAVSLPHGVVGTVLAKDCMLSLPHAELERIVTRLRAMPGLNLDLTRRIADIDARIGTLSILRERAAAVRKELAALQR